MITNDRILAKRFNEHYINIVERSSAFKPSKMSFSVESRINNHFLKFIASQYKDHPSIVNIRKNALNNTHLGISSFSTEEVTPVKVNSIIKSLDENKAPGTDKMPMKLIILVSDFLSKPISLYIIIVSPHVPFQKMPKLPLLFQLIRKLMISMLYPTIGLLLY